jgi:beta-glucosidase
MVLSEKIEIEGSKCDTCSNTEIPTWYHTLEGVPTRDDFERLIGRKIVIKELKKGEFTMQNTALEMKDYSIAMKLLYKIIEIVVSKGFDGKKDYNNPTYRMMISSAADCSLTGIKIVNSMNNGLLEGLLEMANGHYLKGLWRMIRG